MRIAMVSEHANPLACLGGVDAGGQNVHVAALAAGLTERGHSVTVFSRRDDPSVPTRVTAPDGYDVEHVPAGPPTEVPKDELLPHMPAFADYLQERWSQDRYDVVHAHFWMSGMASSRAAHGLQLPVVQTFHALGTVKRRHQGAADTSPPTRLAIEARLCRTVDRVIATCSDEVDELLAMGMPAGKADIVPCGVDVRRFQAAPQPTSQPYRLLTLGRLVERKGIADAIEALAQLPGVELVVVGGPTRDALSADPEACRLMELSRRLGVEDRVEFIGRVEHDDVPALIHSAHLVVTTPWYEPFGIVPVEAMACGRPVVGSAVGGLLDTVVPNVTGELVEPRRPDKLASTLCRLLSEPHRRAMYGAAGRERAVSKYRWEQVAAATETVYSSVLAGRPRTSEEVLS
jgi:glycosyltransferase involved in cell wall biosynthesis